MLYFCNVFINNFGLREHKNIIRNSYPPAWRAYFRDVNLERTPRARTPAIMGAEVSQKRWGVRSYVASCQVLSFLTHDWHLRERDSAASWKTRTYLGILNADWLSLKMATCNWIEISFLIGRLRTTERPLTWPFPHVMWTLTICHTLNYCHFIEKKRSRTRKHVLSLLRLYLTKVKKNNKKNNSSAPPQGGGIGKLKSSP